MEDLSYANLERLRELPIRAGSVEAQITSLTSFFPLGKVCPGRLAEFVDVFCRMFPLALQA
jgi:hypothetical protein